MIVASLAPWLVVGAGAAFLPLVLYGVAELRVSWRAKLALLLPYVLGVAALSISVR